jgi:hypothetical protein
MKQGLWIHKAESYILKLLKWSLQPVCDMVGNEAWFMKWHKMHVLTYPSKLLTVLKFDWEDSCKYRREIHIFSRTDPFWGTQKPLKNRDRLQDAGVDGRGSIKMKLKTWPMVVGRTLGLLFTVRNFLWQFYQKFIRRLVEWSLSPGLEWVDIYFHTPIRCYCAVLDLYAPCYKPEGRALDSQWDHWTFQFI